MSDFSSLARPEILAMKPYESARSSAGADGILLNANEAPRSLLDEPELNRLNRYPVPQPEDLRNRLAEIYAVDPGRVLITRGSDEGIDLLTRVFCRPGTDAIVECSPCFGMYRIAAGIQAADVIDVARSPVSNLIIDFDLLCETISGNSNIRLVFLTSPNNPTGDVISHSNMKRVLAACDKHALLVLDEAYIEFCQSPSATCLLDRWPNLVVLRTLSKAWGAAGLRCGSVIADPQVISLLKRVMAPYPLTTPAIDDAMAVTQPAVIEKQTTLLAEIESEKSLLIGFLQQKPWVKKLWPGEANFVLLRVDDAAGLTAYCAEKGVRIRDFSNQEALEGCVRITIGSSTDMAALKAVLENYGEPA